MMQNFEQLFDYIDTIGEGKCLFFHPEKGAFMIVKADDYQRLSANVKKEANISQSAPQSPLINAFINKPHVDVNYYEIERKVPRLELEEDEYYPETLA